MAPLPALMDDLVSEILLRLPPDEPACLVRASLVCKPWRRLLADPAFLRRYRAFHQPPPVLGFLHNLDDNDTNLALFVPTSAFCPPHPEFLNWYALDSRHGRVLFHTLLLFHETMDLAVWDPITGGQWGLCLPDCLHRYWNATVLCAAGGCDHLNCHGGPFLVAFVATGDEGLASACVYSSEADAWSDLTSVEHPDACADMKPSVLVGSTLYFICTFLRILEYDLGGQELAVIDAPFAYRGGAALMVAEDGGLGFAGVQGYSINLWSREVDANGVARWAQRRAIELVTMFPIGALSTAPAPDVIGFAEDVCVIFVRTNFGVFTIEVKSARVREVSSNGRIYTAIPYTSFYIPDLATDRLPPP